MRRLAEEGEGIERSSTGSGRGEEEQRARERKEAGGWMENDHRTELGFRGHIHVWCGPLDPGDPTVICP